MEIMGAYFKHSKCGNLPLIQLFNEQIGVPFINLECFEYPVSYQLVSIRLILTTIMIFFSKNSERGFQFTHN